MPPTLPTDDQLHRWVETWKRVGPLLQEIRDRELLSTDTIGAVQALSEAFRAARRQNPPRPTSGLVDQQRYFRGLRG